MEFRLWSLKLHILSPSGVGDLGALNPKPLQGWVLERIQAERCRGLEFWDPWGSKYTNYVHNGESSGKDNENEIETRVI